LETRNRAGSGSDDDAKLGDTAQVRLKHALPILDSQEPQQQQGYLVLALWTDGIHCTDNSLVIPHSSNTELEWTAQ